MIDGNDFAVNSMTESELQEAVESLFRAHGWLVYHTRNSQGSEPGALDILAVKSPRVVFIELKRESGKLNKKVGYTRSGRRMPTQKEWFEALEECSGVETYLCKPSDWFAGRIDRIEGEKNDE